MCNHQNAYIEYQQAYAPDAAVDDVMWCPDCKKYLDEELPAAPDQWVAIGVGDFLEAAEAAGAVPVVAYSLDDLAAAMGIV